MDSDQSLSVHWPSVKDKDMKLLQREPKTHAQRGPASSSGFAPWAAEGIAAAAAPVRDRWA
eukprot:1622571-Pyramimonas_sp.AAC.1